MKQRLSPDLLEEDQQIAIDRLYEGCLLVAEMGAGKTVIGATAAAERIDDGHSKRILIVTTPKIANTVWAQEFDAWEHTHHITVVAATGTPKQRLEDIKNEDNQVVVVTFNVLPWMAKEGLFKYFDGLLIDETTKLTSVGGSQFKALRRHLKKFTWRAGLTGTPVAENYMNLYAQAMLIDAGKALGTNYDTFLRHYFVPTDFNEYNWVLRAGMEPELMFAVRDAVHVMPDYSHTLEELDEQEVPLTMPDDLRALYDDMRRDMVNEVAEAQTVAVMYQKLAQLSCGFVYDEHGEAIRVSRYRQEALIELLNGELADNNVVICYWYQDDLRVLREMLPEAEHLTPKNTVELSERWNRGEVKHLLIHPRSAGHGLRLEQGGHDLVWLQPYWSNDLEEQVNARLRRRGQTKQVRVWYLVAEDSIDELMLVRVDTKKQNEKMFYDHLRK